MEYVAPAIYFLSFVVVVSYGRMEKNNTILDADLFIMDDKGIKLKRIVNSLFTLMIIAGVGSLLLNWKLAIIVIVAAFVIVRLAPFWTDDLVSRFLRLLTR